MTGFGFDFPRQDIERRRRRRRPVDEGQGRPERFFNAFLWGADLSAPQDATVIFYEIIRDASGSITDVSFNFVVKEVFARSYTFCPETDH